MGATSVKSYFALSFCCVLVWLRGLCDVKGKSCLAERLLTPH